LIQSVLITKTVSMQPNFTLRKSNFPRLVLSLLTSLLILSTVVSQAQTTISTTGFANNNANALITFNFKNNNTYSVVLTGISSIASTAGTLDVRAFYKTSAINGAPGAIDATNGWTQFGNGTITGVANTSTTTTQPFFTNLSLIVPAGATYGIVLEAVLTGTTTAALRYSTVAAGTYTFSGGGCDVITGTNIGYGGVASPGAPTFTPRAFMGDVIFTQAVACTGTPTPGNTLSSVTSVCSGINFNLSLQNSAPAIGLTYQWQSSPDGSTWTNITGATSSSLIRSQTAATYYRCQVTCSGNTGTSTAVLVGMNPQSACYCAAAGTTTTFENVGNVSFGTINNTSTSAAGYENFTNLSTSVIAGQVLPITVTIGGAPYGSDQVIVWIDFNQNGSFTDPGEQVFTSPLGAGPHTGNITIASAATSGPTRMRVRVHDAAIGGNTTPCGNSTYGQVEDYTVNIQPCVPGAFTTQPANTTITCGGNATFTVAASGSVPAFTWQYRTSATGIWQELTNGGVVSGATTATLTLTNVPTTWSGYEIRSILRGPCTGANPSNAATFTVNPIQTAVSPASATICNGTVQRLTITNFASTSAPMTSTFTSTDVPKAIPDANAAGVLSNLTVSGLPAGATITGLAVKFSIPNHTWPGDVVVVLRTPNGQVLNLDYYISGTGFGPGTGMVNTNISSTGTVALGASTSPTFTGTFRADRAGAADAAPSGMPVTTTAWASLYGPANGTYTLGCRDSYGGDIGTLTAWSVDVTYVIPSYGEGVWTATPAQAGTMFLDAAATVPYNGTREDTIYVKPSVNTVYSVFFNSTISPCTSAPAQVPITVGLPITNLSVPATVATCVGKGFTITATHDAVPATNAAPVYQWQQSTDGGVTWASISGATTTTLTVASTTQSMNGVRYRILSQSGTCAVAASGSSTLTVNALPVITLSAPTVSLTPGRTTTVTGTSSPAAAAWTWTLNGGTLAGTSATQTVNIDGLGNYQATVRDVNGCINSSNVLAIGADASDKLWIYPNPTSGAFQVRYYFAGDMNEKRIVSVYNAAGQLVATQTFNLSFTSSPYLRMDVDLSGAARGTYVVKVAHAYSGKIVSGLVLVQ
jgi:subtilisin-like proprotein convertase family protein